MTGPSVKPEPQAAPIKPKFRARFSSLLMSPMYPPAAANEAPKTPATARPTNNQVIEVARPVSRKSTPNAASDHNNTGRRPMRSLMLPKMGAMKNCSSAYTAMR